MDLRLITNSWKTRAACIALTVSVSGCAMPNFAKKTSKPTTAVAESTSVTKRQVQTIRQEPAEVDGQTSWIIEPDVPRIPKVAGLDPNLPPHIQQRLSRAFDLAQRGATYSANTEFREVLTLCALELDAGTSGTSHRDALRQAFIAVEEAEDISGRDATDIRLAVVGHTTPVLRDDIDSTVDSIHGVQLYYAYAEERFAYACEGMPAASLAYYGLARTYVLPGTRYPHAAGRAVMLHRVALRIAPQNVLSGNELGVLLAQHGHLPEAESIFRQCVATEATPEAWQNLAAVCAKQGKTEASRAAKAAAMELAASRAAHQQTISESAVVVTDDPSVAPESLAKSDPSMTPQPAAYESTTQTEREGFWSRLDLAQKLPGVFRR